jgi:FtsH-binding integral membrane protein
MLTTVQVYVEATIAIAIMITLGIITGFVAAGVTGDRMFSFGAGFIMLAVSGALLVIRLWHMTRMPLVPPVGG